MSSDRATRPQESKQFDVENHLREFREELKVPGDVSLISWAREVPDEVRNEVIPRMVEDYRGACEKQGTTMDVSLGDEYPQFRHLFDLDSGKTASVDGLDTVRTYPLTATSEYAVEEWHWIQGGQGVVHKAREPGIGDRQVVVKFLKDVSHSSNFHKEVEVTAQLEHPGVAAVFARGVDERPAFQRPFFAMRLIHGDSLEQRIADFHHRIESGRVEARKAFWRTGSDGIAPIVENIISACHPVSYAHSVGVLHCDLKPKNIVCGRFGATVVLDWGSACAYQVSQANVSDSAPPIEVPDDTDQSYTLPYASPEQIRREKLSPRSDVYALGANLYQAITGSPPFDADRSADARVEFPSEQRRRGSRRLRAICYKAMEPRAADRYESVDAFQQDLTNWLRDEEVSAAPDRIFERLFRIARHHKLATVIGAFALIVVMLLASVACNLYWSGRHASRSLETSMALIGDLCKPLENDQINSAEFKDRSQRIGEFARNYISENSWKRDEKLARAHEFLALVQFYEYNHNRERSSQASLKNAIHSLEKARSLYQSLDTQLLQAENLVRQARWKRVLMTKEGDKEQTLQLTGDALRGLQQAIRILGGVSNEGTDSERARRVLAEANHVLGEMLLWNKNFIGGSVTSQFVVAEGQPADSVRSNLDESLESFTRAIDLILSMSAEPDRERDLARGYGFRGDAYKARGIAGNQEEAFPDFQAAFEDYRVSLDLRRAAERNPENMFQLARGWVNFGTLVRDVPTDEQLDRLKALMAENRAEGIPDMEDVGASDPVRPIEVDVCKTYVERGIDITTAMSNAKDADKRFRDDQRWMSNRAAELYLLAAARPTIAAESKREYLDDAKRFVKLALGPENGQTDAELFELPANVKNELANSFTVLLQAEYLSEGGGDRDVIADHARRVVGLIEFKRLGFQHLQDDQLLAYAIVVAATSPADLREVVEEIRKRELGASAPFQKRLSIFSEQGTVELLQDLMATRDE